MHGVGYSARKAVRKAVSSASGLHHATQKTTRVIFAEKSIFVHIVEFSATMTRERMATMQSHEPCTREFDFTLLLDDISTVDSTVEDALFEAGCDDATISRRFGRVFLTFSREATSLKAAIISAIQDVKRSKIPAVMLRVDECDLVTQADIARRISRSRQMVHQYISGQRGPGSFPPPACNITDGVPLWYWCEAAYWFWQNGIIREDVLRAAQEVAVINSVLELEYQRHLDPELTKEIVDSLCLCEPA